MKQKKNFGEKKNKKPWADFVSNISPIIMTNMVTNTNTPFAFSINVSFVFNFPIGKNVKIFSKVVWQGIQYY